MEKIETWQLALQAFNEGRNILLTGGAGTGKSYNLGKLIEYFEANDIECARTAMTGMASLQMIGGETVHSCFKTGINSNKKALSAIVSSFGFRKEAFDRISILDVIIIDEISMMRSDFLELLDALCRYVTGLDKPFGGKQVIFSGDFMQLPPVVKGDEDIKDSFWAFESPVWQELNFKVVYLTEIKRQDNKEFSTALNLIRAGAVNPGVSSYFFKSHQHVFPEGIRPVKLLSTNIEVDTSNAAMLKNVKTDEEFYSANVWAISDYLRKKIIQDVTAVELLTLKVGCQVMILKNCKGSYVNGSMGEYLGRHCIIHEDGREAEALKIRLFDNDQVVYVEKAEWTIEKPLAGGLRDVQARFVQFPVKLGYAITIHKSQGMSIDYLEVNLGKCFADGMAYVALSRARKYEGLRVTNWNPGAVKCNKKAFGFYMGLKNNGII